MPTPRDSVEELLPQIEPHASCPPDSQWSRQVLGDIEHAIADVTNVSSSSPQPLIDGDSLHDPKALGDGPDSRNVANSFTSSPNLELTPPPLSVGLLKEDLEEKSAASGFATNACSALDLSYSDRHGIVSPRVISLYPWCLTSLTTRAS